MAPDRVRIEQSGRLGYLTVSDGVDLHHYSLARKRYTKAPMQRDAMVGVFRPELPSVNEATFLFQRVAEKVIAAEILREERMGEGGFESDCYVVSVEYEPDSRSARLISFSPVVFFVDSQTNLIRKATYEHRTRIPATEETRTLKHSVEFRNAAFNQAIPPETFEYSPPAEALAEPADFSFIANASGHASFGNDQSKWVESLESSDWEGEAYVQRSKLRMRGIEVKFERRLSISEDRKELHITERVFGPKGEAEHEFSMPAL